MGLCRDTDKGNKDDDEYSGCDCNEWIDRIDEAAEGSTTTKATT